MTTGVHIVNSAENIVWSLQTVAVHVWTLWSFGIKVYTVYTFLLV